MVRHFPGNTTVKAHQMISRRRIVHQVGSRIKPALFGHIAVFNAHKRMPSPADGRLPRQLLRELKRRNVRQIYLCSLLVCPYPRCKHAVIYRAQRVKMRIYVHSAKQSIGLNVLKYGVCPRHHDDVLARRIIVNVMIDPLQISIHPGLHPCVGIAE